MAKHNETGKQGEALAAIWLEEHGYNILYKNWRHKNWEIDVIAVKANRLHIIEVKTRRSTIYGYPEENIDENKMQYLINAAEEYMEQDERWKQLQFDILAISIDKKEIEYFLIEDVYL
ncbi:MAG: YraN family protein [Ferruginibacter sp.]